MVKIWSHIGFFLTFFILIIGMSGFIFLRLLNLSLVEISPSLSNFVYGVFVFCGLLLSFFTGLKFLNEKKMKTFYETLFYQANALCENINIQNELLEFLKKLQNITLTTPELTVKILKRYLIMPVSQTEISSFSPPQQAAIILSCLNRRAIKRVYKRFKPEEIKVVNQLIFTLGYVSNEDKYIVLSKFLSEITSPISNIFDNFPLQSSLPLQQAIEILKKENLYNSQKDAWKILNSVSTKRMINHLLKLSVHSIAIILYNLQDDKVVEILKCFPEEVCGQVLFRLMALKSVSRSRLKMIDSKVENSFLIFKSQDFYHGWQKVAAILSLLPLPEKNRMISILRFKSEKMASFLSKKILCFDDFSRWSDMDVSYLIKKTPEHILLRALAGADNKTKMTFVNNMSPKRWGNLLKKLDSSPINRVKEIDEAQFFIIKKARVLIEKKGNMKK